MIGIRVASCSGLAKGLLIQESSWDGWRRTDLDMPDYTLPALAGPVHSRQRSQLYG
jgi:hypothetical protein